GGRGGVVEDPRLFQGFQLPYEIYAAASPNTGRNRNHAREGGRRSHIRTHGLWHLHVSVPATDSWTASASRGGERMALGETSPRGVCGKCRGKPEQSMKRTLR